MIDARYDHVPALRVHPLCDAAVRTDGDYVLMWMTGFRRLAYNYTLDRAVAWCRTLGKPLLVFEPLRAGYRWSSDRIHQFVLEGMAENQATCEKAGITYYPYVENAPGDGKGLLAAMSERAAVVLGDDYPGFFLPKMRASLSEQLGVRCEVIDSNGIIPLRASDKAYPSAASYRRIVQREAPKYVQDCPQPGIPKDAVLRGAPMPEGLLKKYPAAPRGLLHHPESLLHTLKIDHSVPKAKLRGGRTAALEHLDRLFADVLGRFDTDRNHPDENGQSGLSPYMHFGYVSSHEIFARLVEHEDWEPPHMAPKATGGKEGFWGMSPQAEAFMDQFVTWRELGYNMAHHRYEDLRRYESLPSWAQDTLAIHTADPRPKIYTLEQLERAETDDIVWNAAQNQLRREGTLHNYMRMLWGKRLIAWTETPKEAYLHLEHLNNKYGVDGRDPNSYSGMLWCFGRYDRPWPENPIFGKVRVMTSASTKKKLKLTEYLKTFGGKGEP